MDAPLSVFQSQVASAPGFYRIRTPTHAELGLVYLGQTGRNLRERTRSLARGIHRDLDDCPWNDPHTAASILWAYRHEDRFEFEVSVAVAHLITPVRQCYEDYLLYLHRIHHGHSTLSNHGRLHPLWTRPTNRTNGIAAKRRDVPVLYPSLPVAFGDDDFAGSHWLDLEWTEFHPLDDLKEPDKPGVYRIERDSKLIYCGQSSNLLSRIHTHSNDPRFIDSAVSVHEMEAPTSHQLKERETDLIGAYFASAGVPPIHQYRPK